MAGTDQDADLLYCCCTPEKPRQGTLLGLLDFACRGHTSTLTLRVQIGPSRASQEFQFPKYEYFHLQWILHAYRPLVCSYPTHDR